MAAQDELKVVTVFHTPTLWLSRADCPKDARNYEVVTVDDYRRLKSDLIEMADEWLKRVESSGHDHRLIACIACATELKARVTECLESR